MNSLRAPLVGLVLFGLGLLAGVYLQHRWPGGHLLRSLRAGPELAPRSLVDLAAIPANRRLVIVAAGQSNAANYGETRRAAGNGVYAFSDGKLYTAVDPLPGADGDGGSVWTRLGARLAMTGDYDAVILVVVAQGSTTVKDWTPGGSCHQRLVETLQQLSAAHLPADYLLWQQGETEAGSSASAGVAYQGGLAELCHSGRRIFPRLVFVAAQATYGSSPAVNEQIRLAQAGAGKLPGALPGPDLDTLGERYRRDGIHFNEAGLAAAADLWLGSLHHSLAAQRGKSTRP